MAIVFIHPKPISAGVQNNDVVASLIKRVETDLAVLEQQIQRISYWNASSAKGIEQKLTNAESKLDKLHDDLRYRSDKEIKAIETKYNADLNTLRSRITSLSQALEQKTKIPGVVENLKKLADVFNLGTQFFDLYNLIASFFGWPSVSVPLLSAPDPAANSPAPSSRSVGSPVFDRVFKPR